MTITLNGTTGITTPALTNSGALTQTGAATLSSTLQAATTIGVGGATPSASGAGITFPATQSASTDANTLDDYEEGTFSPTPQGSSTAGTVTYINRIGSYVKIGRQVTCWIHLNWNSGTGSGALQIAGLPFTSADNNNYAVPSVYFDSISITSGNQFESYFGPNDTKINFIQYSSSSSATSSISYDAQGVILATVTYLAAA